MQNKKEFLKNEVLDTLDYIAYMESKIESRLKENIKKRVEEAHAVALNIYRENYGLRGDAQIKKMIKDALRPISFNDGNGYFYAFTMTGVEVLFADKPEMEGKAMLGVQGAQGRFVVKEMIDILQQNGEGYYTYFWTKPDNGMDEFQKISFIKKFEPYQWGIGTGIYLDDMKKMIQDEVLARISAIRSAKEGYLFGSIEGGLPLFTNGKITKGGASIWELTDPDGVKIIQEQNRVAKDPGGGFVRYAWRKIDSEAPLPKLSYVKYIPQWKWIIGSGLYIDTIDQDFQIRKQALVSGFKKDVCISFFFILSMALLIYLWTRHLAHRMDRGIKTFSKFFEKASTSSVIMEPASLPFTEFQEIAGFANSMVEKRIQAVTELERNERRYREAQEMGKVGNWEYYPESRRFWASDGTKRIFGLNSDDDWFSADDLEHCIADWKRLNRSFLDFIKKDLAYEQEYEIQPKNDGNVKTIFSQAVLERDQNGIPVNVRGIVHDITQRKHLERELLQAHKMEAVGTLSGGIAHEFNNILSIILGNAELAVDDVASGSAAHRFFNEIKYAGLRGKDIVSQLLNFSRKEEPCRVPLHLDNIVGSSLTFLRASIPATIQFQELISVDCHPILGNETQIHQVMINLCNNAVHAMEPSGGTLLVRLENVDLSAPLTVLNQTLPPGRYVRLGVEDTGGGIPYDIMDYVFDPFFTTKPVDKGTGMGLAVVHGIMKAHDGIIHISSRLQVGTTCECYFPARMVKPEEKSEPSNDGGTGTERILFVDDEPALTQLGQMMLERLGYQVVVKNDPREALDFYKENFERIDLVITDMTMPVMTGAQLIEMLKKVNPHIGTVICTGDDSGLNGVGGVEDCPADAFIMKPYRKSDLGLTVRNVLNTVFKRVS